MKRPLTAQSPDVVPLKSHPPILSFVGSSGTGKTTLLEKLIPDFLHRGFRIGSLKHDVHGFQMDKPGKDSWRLTQAGAAVSVISSPNRIGMVMNTDHDSSPEELRRLFPDVDIILTEGYKRGKRPKIEVFRTAVSTGLLCASDPHLLAVVSDTNIDVRVPVFDPGDPSPIVNFIVARFNLRRQVNPGPRKTAS